MVSSSWSSAHSSSRLNSRCARASSPIHIGAAAKQTRTKRRLSGFVGVSPNGAKSWKAEFSWNKKRTYLGSFKTALDAAIAYADRHFETAGSSLMIPGGRFEPLGIDDTNLPSSPACAPACAPASCATACDNDDDLLLLLQQPIGPNVSDEMLDNVTEDQVDQIIAQLLESDDSDSRTTDSGSDSDWFL